MNIKEATESMVIMKRLFDIHSVNYFLGFGALLGMIREGKLIEWDEDVDLAVMCNDMPKVSFIKNCTLINKFEIYYNGHYSVRNKNTKEHIICLLVHMEKNGIIYWIDYIPPITYFIRALESDEIDYTPLDYFVVQAIKLKSINTLYKKSINILFIISRKIKKKQQLIGILFKIQMIFHLYHIKNSCKSDIIMSLTTGILYDNEYPIPAKPEEYLESLYGNWKIPMREDKIVKEWRGKKLKLNKNNELIPMLRGNTK